MLGSRGRTPDDKSFTFRRKHLAQHLVRVVFRAERNHEGAGTLRTIRQDLRESALPSAPIPEDDGLLSQLKERKGVGLHEVAREGGVTLSGRCAEGQRLEVHRRLH